MKYSEGTYESGRYFSSTEYSDSKRVQKIVKGSHSHTCEICDKEIPAGEKSLSFKDLIPKEGWNRCWICLDCCNRWLEATRQV